MTPEMIAIVSVGVALAGLILTLFIRTERRFEQMEARIDSRFEQMETRIDRRFEQMETRIDRRFEQTDTSIRESEQRLDAKIVTLDAKIVALDSRVSVIERGQARLEGLLDGIREALFGRAPAGPS